MFVKHYVHVRKREISNKRVFHNKIVILIYIIRLYKNLIYLIISTCGIYF